jgi:hypothetical protein
MVSNTASISRLLWLTQFKMIASLSSSNFLTTGTKTTRLKTSSRQAMIAASRLTSEDTNDSIPFDETEEAATDGVALTTRKRSVYFSYNKDGHPIVIYTGASVFLTPNLKDFVGGIRPAPIGALNGLSTTTTVHGMGTVEWTICDLFGVALTFALQPTMCRTHRSDYFLLRRISKNRMLVNVWSWHPEPFSR